MKEVLTPPRGEPAQFYEFGVYNISENDIPVIFNVGSILTLYPPPLLASSLNNVSAELKDKTGKTVSSQGQRRHLQTASGESAAGELRINSNDGTRIETLLHENKHAGLVKDSEVTRGNTHGERSTRKEEQTQGYPASSSGEKKAAHSNASVKYPIQGKCVANDAHTAQNSYLPRKSSFQDASHSAEHTKQTASSHTKQPAASHPKQPVASHTNTSDLPLPTNPFAEFPVVSSFCISISLIVDGKSYFHPHKLTVPSKEYDGTREDNSSVSTPALSPSLENLVGPFRSKVRSVEIHQNFSFPLKFSQLPLNSYLLFLVTEVETGLLSGIGSVLLFDKFGLLKQGKHVVELSSPRQRDIGEIFSSSELGLGKSNEFEVAKRWVLNSFRCRKLQPKLSKLMDFLAEREKVGRLLIHSGNYDLRICDDCQFSYYPFYLELLEEILSTNEGVCLDEDVGTTMAFKNAKMHSVEDSDLTVENWRLKANQAADGGPVAIPPSVQEVSNTLAEGSSLARDNPQHIHPGNTTPTCKPKRMQIAGSPSSSTSILQNNSGRRWLHKFYLAKFLYLAKQIDLLQQPAYPRTSPLIEGLSILKLQESIVRALGKLLEFKLNSLDEARHNEDNSGSCPYLHDPQSSIPVSENKTEPSGAENPSSSSLLPLEGVRQSDVPLVEPLERMWRADFLYIEFPHFQAPLLFSEPCYNNRNVLHFFNEKYNSSKELHSESFRPSLKITYDEFSQQTNGRIGNGVVLEQVSLADLSSSSLVSSAAWHPLRAKIDQATPQLSRKVSRGSNTRNSSSKKPVEGISLTAAAFAETSNLQYADQNLGFFAASSSTKGTKLFGTSSTSQSYVAHGSIPGVGNFFPPASGGSSVSSSASGVDAGSFLGVAASDGKDKLGHWFASSSNARNMSFPSKNLQTRFPSGARFAFPQDYGGPSAAAGGTISSSIPFVPPISSIVFGAKKLFPAVYAQPSSSLMKLADSKSLKGNFYHSDAYYQSDYSSSSSVQPVLGPSSTLPRAIPYENQPAGDGLIQGPAAGSYAGFLNAASSPENASIPSTSERLNSQNMSIEFSENYGNSGINLGSTQLQPQLHPVSSIPYSSDVSYSQAFGGGNLEGGVIFSGSSSGSSSHTTSATLVGSLAENYRLLTRQLSPIWLSQEVTTQERSPNSSSIRNSGDLSIGKLYNPFLNIIDRAAPPCSFAPAANLLTARYKWLLSGCFVLSSNSIHLTNSWGTPLFLTESKLRKQIEQRFSQGEVAGTAYCGKAQRQVRQRAGISQDERMLDSRTSSEETNSIRGDKKLHTSLGNGRELNSQTYWKGSRSSSATTFSDDTGNAASITNKGEVPDSDAASKKIAFSYKPRRNLENNVTAQSAWRTHLERKFSEVSLEGEKSDLVQRESSGEASLVVDESLQASDLQCDSMLESGLEPVVESPLHSQIPPRESGKQASHALVSPPGENEKRVFAQGDIRSSSSIDGSSKDESRSGSDSIASFFVNRSPRINVAGGAGGDYSNNADGSLENEEKILSDNVSFFVFRMRATRILLIEDFEAFTEHPSLLKHQILAKAEVMRGGANASNALPTPNEQRILHDLIYSPRRHLNAEEKDLLWKYRLSLLTERTALTKFLRCVDWSDASKMKHVLELIQRWAPGHIDDALELLSADFSTAPLEVQEYAINILKNATDLELKLYLLQLVQAIRYDGGTKFPINAVPPLTAFLVERAASSSTLATLLHWYLQCEVGNQETSHRFVRALAALNDVFWASAVEEKELRGLRGVKDKERVISHEILQMLQDQIWLKDQLMEASRIVKECRDRVEKKTERLKDWLHTRKSVLLNGLGGSSSSALLGGAGSIYSNPGNVTGRYNSISTGAAASTSTISNGGNGSGFLSIGTAGGGAAMVTSGGMTSSTISSGSFNASSNASSSNNISTNAMKSNANNISSNLSSVNISNFLSVNGVPSNPATPADHGKDSLPLINSQPQNRQKSLSKGDLNQVSSYQEYTAKSGLSMKSTMFDLINLDRSIPLPVDPDVRLRGIVPERSFVTKSSLYPIVLCCKVEVADLPLLMCSNQKHEKASSSSSSSLEEGGSVIKKNSIPYENLEADVADSLDESLTTHTENGQNGGFENELPFVVAPMRRDDAENRERRSTCSVSDTKSYPICLPDPLIASDKDNSTLEDAAGWLLPTSLPLDCHANRAEAIGTAANLSSVCVSPKKTAASSRDGGINIMEKPSCQQTRSDTKVSAASAKRGDYHHSCSSAEFSQKSATVDSAAKGANDIVMSSNETTINQTSYSSVEGMEVESSSRTRGGTNYDKAIVNASKGREGKEKNAHASGNYGIIDVDTRKNASKTGCAIPGDGNNRYLKNTGSDGKHSSTSRPGDSASRDSFAAGTGAEDGSKSFLPSGDAPDKKKREGSKLTEGENSRYARNSSENPADSARGSSMNRSDSQELGTPPGVLQSQKKDEIGAGAFESDAQSILCVDKEAARDAPKELEVKGAESTPLGWGSSSFQKISPLPSPPMSAPHGIRTLKNYMFKVGDDLRQDQLVIQMIILMDSLLKRYGLDLKLTPYKVIALSTQGGIIEFVSGSRTLSFIKRNYKGGIREFFMEQIPLTPFDPPQHPSLDTFIRSCAGYSVITYVLGIGDRHLDNLLILPEGNLFHIDFGYILGEDPKPLPPPMRLCREMVEAMGGAQSEGYNQFRSKCCQTFKYLRRNARLILNLLYLMKDAGIKDMKMSPDMAVMKVQRRFRLDLNEEEAEAHLLEVINISVKALFPAVVDKLHEWAQYYK